MLPENQTNKNPAVEANKTIPTSMANSGVNLDPCCEGGMGGGADLSEIAGWKSSAE